MKLVHGDKVSKNRRDRNKEICEQVRNGTYIPAKPYN
jgi:hypothetical protein